MNQGRVDITQSPAFFPENFIVTVSNATPSTYKHPARDSTTFTKCYQHSGYPPRNGRFKVRHWLVNQTIEATHFNLDVMWIISRWIWNTWRLYWNPGQASCYYFYNSKVSCQKGPRAHLAGYPRIIITFIQFEIWLLVIGKKHIWD